jgi:signal transduction histidine kinase/DNA-binding response OmpR family regulator
MPQEHILILEDNAEVRDRARRVLSDAGFYVHTAASAAEAIQAAQREPFDLLLADVYLPGLNGLEAFQQIRATRPDVAGVVMTGYSTWEMAMEALRAGFAGFLVKPFAPEQLVSAVVAALEQEKLRRENARLRALVPLYEISNAFMGTTDLADLLRQIVATARQETQAEVVSLMLMDEDQRTLSIAAAEGLSPDILESPKLALGSGIAGWVAEHGEPLMIAEGLPLDPRVRQAMGKPQILSALSLPLRVRGQTIGVLNLSRLSGAEAFTQSDSELAAVLAGQAAVAIDQARLISELHALNETSQGLARARDLDQVAEIFVRVPVPLFHARRVALWLFSEEDNPVLTAAVGFTPDEEKNLQPPAEIFLAPSERFTPKAEGGVLLFPLTRGEKKIGLLEILIPSSTAPHEDRLGLLRPLAHTAAAVIESHQLQRREVAAFRQVDTVMRSDLNLREALDRVLKEAIVTCEAEGGAIFLRGAEHEQLDLWLTSGLGGSADLARMVMLQNQPALFDVPPSAATPEPGLRAAIGTPMVVGSRTEGAILLTHRTPQAFDARHLNLLSILTTSTGLIVRNAQLYARSEEATITEERTRIAREIHDGLAQELSFLVMKVEITRRLHEQKKSAEVGKELTEIVDALRRDVREVRQTIFALRPLELEALGFRPALEKFVSEFGQANDIRVDLQIHGNSDTLSPKTETALFRLTQEALNNIRKHAHAAQVWIELDMRDGRTAFLRVSDDGVGFDPEVALKAARERGSVGMIQMRERAERAGGTFRFETVPGQGTRVEVAIPMRGT